MHLALVKSEAEWEQAKAIRQRVFIEEQCCPPEEEWDEHDATSRHILGYVEGVPVATARWRRTSYEDLPAARLERFAVIPEARGQGYGRELVAFVLEDARSAGSSTQVLHAQAHLQRFYASFGFRPMGGVFEEVGIPHVLMVCRDAEAD